MPPISDSPITPTPPVTENRLIIRSSLRLPAPGRGRKIIREPTRMLRFASRYVEEMTVNPHPAHLHAKEKVATSPAVTIPVIAPVTGSSDNPVWQRAARQ